MNEPGHAARWILLATALACCATTGHAITDEEVYRDIRFNFINPGGRSLGLGGAFIAIANDATAAQANPAGLTNLSTAQLFAEGRLTEVDSTSTTRSFDFPLTDPPDGFDIAIHTEPRSTTTPSFLSYVYPLGRVYLALSRQEVLNIRNSTDNTAVFRVGAGDVDARRGRGEIDLQLVHWNAGIGVLVHEKLRLGATLSYGRLDLRSSIFNSYELVSSPDPANQSFVGVPIELYSTRSDGTDDDLSLTVGVLWKPTPALSIGGVLRQGGDYAVEQELTAQRLSLAVPGLITSRVFFNESGTELTAARESVQFPGEFHVPDTIGAGLAWRPLERLEISADLVRVAWSDLLRGFNSRLNVLTIGWETEEQAAFVVDDQTDLHVGVQYDLPSTGPRWSLRGGFHTSKDNRIRADFPEGDSGFGLGSNANFAAGRDANHYSLGVGLVLNSVLQLDFAGDVSRNTLEVVTSLTYRFGGSN